LSQPERFRLDDSLSFWFKLNSSLCGVVLRAYLPNDRLPILVNVNVLDRHLLFALSAVSAKASVWAANVPRELVEGFVYIALR